MRIALAQINPTVGDVAANSAKIIDFAHRARSDGANVVVFPELSIIGYPPKDLLLKPSFIDDNLRAVERIAAQTIGVEVLVGFVERNPNPVGRSLFNTVALLRDGQIAARYHKALLPTYDVFDESRYFEPGAAQQSDQLVRIGNVSTGLTICEDLWNDERLISRRLYHNNPIADLFTRAGAGIDVILNASASPFVAGKQEFRLQLFGSQAKRFAKPLIVVNQVGGNDELIFDGNSVAFDAQGQLIAHAKSFEEDLIIVDVAQRAAGVSPASSDLEEIYKALLLGLHDYVHKCGFKSVVLGLSGGIDSALTATLAVHALGKDKVVGVAMPSRFSSEHSIADARQLATNLGIEFHIIPITQAHDAYDHTLSPTFRASNDGPPLGDDLTEQNIQARIRGAILMAFSNRYNHLLLTTGNKSEIAVGYCTLYGDMCGGLAVISDVPKTTVWSLSRWINEKFAREGGEIIPRSSIEKVPSAELRPDQTDQDSLPPYEILDAILHRYVEEEKSAAEIIREEGGFDAATVTRIIRLIDRSEYKRRQMPPGLKVTSRAFGFGRRMPIAQNYTQAAPSHGEPGPQER